MFGLSHLFYPWGFLVQIVAIIHFVRRRPENYWIYIIFFGGFIGATAYLVVEALPDVVLLRGVFQGFGRRKRIEAMETLIIDNPSAGNYEELGELYFEQKKFAQAREAFNKGISARSDSPHAFYYRAEGLLADAYARTGQLERAAAHFANVTQFSTTPETLYNYACFLRLQNQQDVAREWAQKLLAKKRTLPRYMQRVERPWFRKGRALLKELSAA